MQLNNRRMMIRACRIAPVVLGIAFSVTVSADPPPCESLDKPVVRTERAGEVVAWFTGERHAEGSGSCCVEELWFGTGAGEPPLRFEPADEMSFGDWQFELFSPDGAYVLLPQHPYGPYHIVAADRLADYLQGGTEPTASLQWRSELGVGALHSAPVWHGPTTGSFLAHCCGTIRVMTFDLAASGDERLRSATLDERAARWQALLTGSRYEVAIVLPASDTPHTLEARRQAEERVGDEVRFGDRVAWRPPEPPSLCEDWHLELTDEERPADRILGQGLKQQELAHGRWAELMCGDRVGRRLFFVEGERRLRFVTRTPNGVAWLVWVPVDDTESTENACAPESD